MLKRFAPLVPFALAALLTACASQAPQDTTVLYEPVEIAPVTEEEIQEFVEVTQEPYVLPTLADNVLERGKTLLGTKYRYGGSSEKTGFDCSGFVGFLFKEEVGMQLPRSTRDMINLDAPVVDRSELEPGDVIFFNNFGRGRVSHTGIYIGDDQFIHSSSRRSGGVRIDSLDDKYWKQSYLEAKRVLALAPDLDE